MKQGSFLEKKIWKSISKSQYLESENMTTHTHANIHTHTTETETEKDQKRRRKREAKLDPCGMYLGLPMRVAKTQAMVGVMVVT